MIAKCPFRLIYVVLCLEVSLKKTLESSAVAGFVKVNYNITYHNM